VKGSRMIPPNSSFPQAGSRATWKDDSCRAGVLPTGGMKAGPGVWGRGGRRAWQEAFQRRNLAVRFRARRLPQRDRMIGFRARRLQRQHRMIGFGARRLPQQHRMIRFGARRLQRQNRMIRFGARRLQRQNRMIGFGPRRLRWRNGVTFWRHHPLRRPIGLEGGGLRP
jgi:hypothetical protein